MCSFLNMESPVKTQVVNGFSKHFNFRGHTIDVSDQSVFILKYSGLHHEEGKKTNVSNPLTAVQMRSGLFLSCMIMVHPDRSDPKCNYSRMTCRDCIQLPLDLGGMYSSIDTQIIIYPQILLVLLSALENGRKPDISTQKKG